MAKVLIMGSDLQSELALLQELQATADAPGLVLDLCHDLADCDLMVVRDNPVLRKAARRILVSHPHLPMWSLAEDGQLFDALHDPPRALDLPQVRATLRALEPDAVQAQAPATPPRPVEPVPARSPQPSALAIEAPPPADPGPLGESIRSRLIAADTVSALALDGKVCLLLDFRRLLALAAPGADLQGRSPEQFLGRHFFRLSQHALQASRYSALFVDLPSVPLIPLLWQATLRMQVEPVLLEPLHEGCRMRLARWPDFRVLAHRHDDFRMCSLLLHRPCTAAEAGQALDVDTGAARAFFNAAWLTGYAQVESSTPQAGTPGPTEATRGAGSLLANMWRGVRGKKGA
ncbi:hypothetical protein [Pseudoxanthomonas sp. JBR18]|uniref:hypothetical protein n=1 Tax=Pseudoxanthomonas sp. JBR18 TaxID=2969308 RepID=UPI002306261D|nr:hypothetical protein [Pseudoxanthomonas sp. JBR18]WCE05816.1 hypothetical protein PJ250_07675 [Pseudoxanthomonas sp. JBR18]